MKRHCPTAFLVHAFLGFTVSGSFATEKQIQELEEEISGIKAKIEALENENGGLQQLLANIESAEKEIEEAKETLPAKEAAVGGKEFLLAAYQSAFRVVTKIPPGENLGSFVLKNGQPVEASSFVSAGNGAILVQGSTGSRSIPLELLPDQFASRILLPPQRSQLSANLSTLKESKPESIRSKEELQAIASTSVESKATGSSVSGAPATDGTTAPDYEAIRKRNLARQNEIAELKLKFADLFTKKKMARQARALDEKTFREAKIKKSQSEVTSTLKIHDDKINQIEMEENAIRQQITRLQSQME
jgi:prefoldin subunit 5